MPQFILLVRFFKATFQKNLFCPSLDGFCCFSGHLPLDSEELNKNPYEHLNYKTRSFAFIYCNQPTCPERRVHDPHATVPGIVGTKRKAPETLSEVLEFISASPTKNSSTITATTSTTTTTVTTTTSTASTTTTTNVEEGQNLPLFRRFNLATSTTSTGETMQIQQGRVPQVSLQLRGDHHKKRKCEPTPTPTTTTTTTTVSTAATTSERHTKPDPILVAALQNVIARRSLSQQQVAQQIEEKFISLTFIPVTVLIFIFYCERYKQFFVSLGVQQFQSS
jgi:hypothetical protein